MVWRERRPQPKTTSAEQSRETDRNSETTREDENGNSETTPRNDSETTSHNEVPETQEQQQQDAEQQKEEEWNKVENKKKTRRGNKKKNYNNNKNNTNNNNNNNNNNTKDKTTLTEARNAKETTRNKHILNEETTTNNTLNDTTTVRTNVTPEKYKLEKNQVIYSNFPNGTTRETMISYLTKRGMLDDIQAKTHLYHYCNKYPAAMVTYSSETTALARTMIAEYGNLEYGQTNDKRKIYIHCHYGNSHTDIKDIRDAYDGIYS